MFYVIKDNLRLMLLLKLHLECIQLNAIIKRTCFWFIEFEPFKYVVLLTTFVCERNIEGVCGEEPH